MSEYTKGRTQYRDTGIHTATIDFRNALEQHHACIEIHGTEAQIEKRAELILAALNEKTK